MFTLTCITVVAALIAMHFFSGVSKIKAGRVYRDRTGNTVTIKYQKRMGDFDIFVAHNGMRYYQNGDRVGDNTQFSKHRLVKAV